MFIQGTLTIGLHCSELIANVVRDEAIWRKATSDKGATHSHNPLALLTVSLPSLGVYATKPVLRECFYLIPEVETE